MKFKELADNILKDYPFEYMYDEYSDGIIDRSKYGKDVDLRDIKDQKNRVSVSLYYPKKEKCTHISVYDDSINTKDFNKKLKEKCEFLKIKIPALRV